MNQVYNVKYFADRYADWKGCPADIHSIERKNCIYNFKATTFNVSTAASIATVALAILSTTPLFLILALLSVGVRRVFMKDLNRSPEQHGKIEILNFRIWMNLAPIPAAQPVIPADNNNGYEVVQ